VRPPTAALGQLLFSTASPAHGNFGADYRPDTRCAWSSDAHRRVRWEQREFAEFYADTGLGHRAPPPCDATCTGPIAYTAQDFFARSTCEPKVSRHAAAHRRSICQRHRPRQPGDVLPRSELLLPDNGESSWKAIAAALREEYRASSTPGFILQLDDPGLPGAWDMLDPSRTLRSTGVTLTDASRS
jgi:hypothetical protein